MDSRRPLNNRALPEDEKKAITGREASFALVVSIETEAEGVDIWTPVAQQIGVPVEVLAELSTCRIEF